jgi:ATP-dependent DNA helicase
MPAQAADKPTAKRETMAKMAADLLRLEGEQIQIVPSTSAGKKAIALSDEELNMLLDRNLIEMANRGSGWNSASVHAGAAKKAAFAVFNAPAVSENNDSFSELMGESVDD